MKALIDARQTQAAQQRAAYVTDIFTDPERYRREFKDMLGWPLTEPSPTALPTVKSEKLGDDNGVEIFRMQVEILDGVWLSGLFFKHNGEKKRPLSIVQHGGWGSPEAIFGFYDGKTFNYNDLPEALLKRGVHVFAPQLLLWEDSYEVPFDRKEIDGCLKRVGSSITAVEVYGIMRILDYFEAQPYVSCLGMMGLSYGGFYTLFTAAIDTRIRAALSCSFFNKRDAVPSSDWGWQNSAFHFDDAEAAALCYPRKLYLQMGKKDPLFDYNNSRSAFEELCALAESVGTDWVRFTAFDGDHEFCKDTRDLDAFIADLLA